MKLLIHRAAPSALAVGMLLLPAGARAGSAPQSLESRLQEALGGSSIVHLAAVSSPAEEGSATQLLASSLPQGVTLKSASDAQMTEAVKSAVARDPKMAANIVRVAIVTQVPASQRKASARPAPRRRARPRISDGKEVSQNSSTYNPWATMGVSGARPHVFIAVQTLTQAQAESFIYNVVFAAVTAAKAEAADIVRAAIAVAPAFSEIITQAALAALEDESDAVKREIIGVAQAADPEHAAAIAALATSSGGSVGNAIFAGLGAASIAGAPAGAGIINPANIGAGNQTPENSPFTP